jgi:MscS family membrane protein
MPESLLQLGPWGLAYWQWIGIGVAIVIAFIAGRVLSRTALWIGHRIVARTESKLDDEALARLNRPVRFLGKLLAARAVLPLLELPETAESTVKQVLLALIGVGVIWCVVALIDVMITRMQGAEWAQKRPASRSLITLAGRTLKVLLVIIAAIAFLSSFGVPVGSLIAGVGIGGIALAFGAQKTVENLFGAFSLGIDQPFREGDFVKVEDVLGTVESLGLRSTKIRTPDRTLVSIPNGKLAEMRLETFAARDRLRLACTLRLVYDTTAPQLRQVLSGAEAALRSHPKIWPDSITVRLKELNVASLDIEINAWFTTSDWDEFMLIRQDLLLDFMRIVAESGTHFALPMQPAPPRAEPARPAGAAT